VGFTSILSFSSGIYDDRILSFVAGTTSVISLVFLQFSSHSYKESKKSTEDLNRILQKLNIEGVIDISKNPEEAYKELSAVKEFNDSMFIKLIVYEEICSKGKFTFKHPEYLLKLVQEGSFNLQDPMLLAYAVRLSNEKLALSVTKELVKKEL
ncbi:MAG: hypothetical protein EBS33_05060, partial [Alphaproteobacteria bacterium]|nr:hypothetical protein [Alphaproteobacteria bacterium]